MKITIVGAAVIVGLVLAVMFVVIRVVLSYTSDPEEATGDLEVSW